MDLKELKIKYGLGTTPETHLQGQPKFGKRRAWLENTEEHNKQNQSSILELRSTSHFEDKSNISNIPQIHIEQAQSRSKSDFFTLVGLKKTVILFLYERCQASRSKIADPVTLKSIASSCGTTAGAVRQIIQHLVKKCFIIRSNFQAERGGGIQYELPDVIYQEILYLEAKDRLLTNLEKHTITTNSQIKADLEDHKIGVLAEDWEKRDYSSLSKIEFTKNHLIQIFKKGALNSSVVQDSIYAFAFDLEKNKKKEKISGSSLNFFMGILKKGTPYAPPDNYESPEMVALKKFLDSKKRILAQTQALKEESQTVAFEIWLSKLSPSDKKKFAPQAQDNGGPLQKGILKNYFIQNIWPAIEKKEFSLDQPTIE